MSNLKLEQLINDNVGIIPLDLILDITINYENVQFI